MAIQNKNFVTQSLIRQFKKSTSLDSLLQAVSFVHKEIDEFFSRTCSKYQIKLACKAGCTAYCCRYLIAISPPEAFHVKKFLENTSTDEKLQIIREKIQSAATSASGLTWKQFINARFSCPFLEQNRCLIYPARPMVCRVFHSTDLGVCAYTDDHPEQNDKDSREPILYLGSIAYRDGFLISLKRVGLDDHVYEMCQTLNVVFSNTAAPKEWRRGQQIFPPSSPGPPGALGIVP